ncbi:hypothetical protein GH714_012798 [Hevea brasiliensis]|uniref:Chromo domain-containing protein n=1 Tax=Hevea brasiliensis TaxID=3981 RepID=A0A6A6L348_HEVBR|nr:hypothetical protein GH714_012798 [Hevea brasiliensis]
MAALHLEGKALQWHQGFIKVRGSIAYLDWGAYVGAITARFGSNAFEDPLADLRNLKQVSSLQDYLDAFDEIYPKAGIREDQALSFFLSGLVDELQMPGETKKKLSKELNSLMTCLNDDGLFHVEGREATAYLYSVAVQEQVELEQQQKSWPDLNNLLLTYNDLFQEPKTLPPKRVHDHRIVLKAGSSPINIRPYKYAAEQKDAIEDMIADIPTLPPVSHIQDAYPQAILDRRMVKRHNAAATQLLIHWRGLSPADASWEYADELQARFPTFLEDKESDGRGS